MQEIPQHIESIIAAMLTGAASSSDADQLRMWIEESPENKALWQQCIATNRLLRAYKKNDRYSSDEAWKKIRPLLQHKKTASRSRMRQDRFTGWFYRIAAIVILAFSAGMVVMYYSLKFENTEIAELTTEYTVPYGSKAKVTLPDRSVVWINAGSTLRYNAAFNQTDREVSVEGEAYFQVAKNPEKPFYVKTPAVTLKVLGTAFNLKAYPDEANIETTVESGSVQVTSNVAGQHVGDLVLTAGQKATVVKASSAKTKHSASPAGTATRTPANESAPQPDVAIKETIVSKGVDTDLYTSWKDKRWLIEKESLESLAVKLERRYNVLISFSDEQLKGYSFSGILEDETLEQVLEVIKLSAPINYKVRHNQVSLTRNTWIDGK